MVKLTPIAITFVAVFVVSTRSGGEVAAFQTAAISDATTTTTSSTSLQALSRRELFSSVLVPATTAAAATLLFTLFTRSGLCGLLIRGNNEEGETKRNNIRIEEEEGYYCLIVSRDIYGSQTSKRISCVGR